MIEDKLKKIMPEKLTESEKYFIWNNIKDSMESRKRLTIGTIFDLKLRHAVAPLIILAMISGGVGTAAYANQAKPGDLLFPIDIATENIRLALSYGNKKDELILKFSNERLEEASVVLDLVALRAQAFGEENTAIAPIEQTEEDSGSRTVAVNSETETSSDTFTAATTSDSEYEYFDETKEELQTKTVAVAESIGTDAADLALEVALEHLLRNRDGFVEKGNDVAVAAIDEIIARLHSLAENYVDKLSSVNIAVKENKNKVSIEVQTSVDKVKTTFKLTENKNKNDGDVSSVAVYSNGVSNSIKVKDGNSNIVYSDSVIKSGLEDNNDSDDGDNNNGDWWEDWWENRKIQDIRNIKITICHKGKTITVSRSALRAHLLHGDKAGKCEDDIDNEAPVISDISANSDSDSAEISWNTNENTGGKVYYATSSPASGNSKSDSGFDDSHDINLSGLVSSTTYEFIIVAWDKAGNTSTSSERSFTTDSPAEPSDEESPVISGVTEDVATTSATISWSTNEESDSRVRYGTSSSYTYMQYSPSLVVSHSLGLVGLMDNTVYYYVVISKDASGNTATSTQGSFTTPEDIPEDSIAPTISNITVSEITASSSIVSWDTDEPATGKIFYNNTSPVVIVNETPNMADSSLYANHSFNLEGLTATTIYYYILVSEDEFGNTATSTEQGFTTL